jgi:BirA family biotin operon repressor/biotin-[acetyl-CoA-carboxylase] ligase
VHTTDITGSTNDDVKKLAETGSPEGTVVIAGEQTAGKGRLGRSFFSPKDTGLYMSVLLRPAVGAADALGITTAAGAAVACALDSVCGTNAGIKWVNDIYIGSRKVCGILTEASLSSDGGMRYAVLGIGVNVADGGFPEDIKTKAGAVGADISLRPLIAAKILELFFGYYAGFPSRSYMDEYRRRSVLTGRVIEYEQGGVLHTASVEGIDDEARLVVRDEGGSVSYLSSGEVSIKSRI